MERKKQLLAGGLVLVGALTFMQMRKLNAPAPMMAAPSAPIVEEVEHEFILVAKTDVARGSRLTPEQLEWQQWPREALTPSFIVQENRASAREELDQSVVRADIYAGEPVIEAKLVRAGESGLMAALLSPGMRAVTTRVSVDSAAGGFILPGDRVDIIQTRQLPRRRDNEEQGSVTQYAANTIFRNVKVLAMNQLYATNPETPASVTAPSYATFELSQADAEFLEEATKTGTLSLTLRGIQSGGVARSSATGSRTAKSGPSSSMVVYRNGQQTQAAIRRQ